MTIGRQRRSAWPRASVLSTFAVLPLIALALLGSIGSAGADPTYKMIYHFCSQGVCAGGTRATLLRDRAGNLYGTSPYGGSHFVGDVFTLHSDGSNYQRIYSFCSEKHCKDGSSPYASLIADVNGNLYGTAYDGGTQKGGTVFELVPQAQGQTWKLIVLHEFCSKTNCADGKSPWAGLTYAGADTRAPYDGVSPLYGTTTAGGMNNNNGVAFAIVTQPGKRKRKESVIYNFCSQANCADGVGPYSQMVADSAGNIYGVSFTGRGVAFELSPHRKRFSETVLYSFCLTAGCPDGIQPVGIASDGKGNLIGATRGGGQFGWGTVFKIVPNGVNSQETVLYSFCALANCADGQEPVGLSVDSSGNIFGTTNGNTIGNVFEVQGNAETVLHTFCSEANCDDGAAPQGSVIPDNQGNVFGAVINNGDHGDGGIFEIQLGAAKKSRQAPAGR